MFPYPLSTIHLVICRHQTFVFHAPIKNQVGGIVYWGDSTIVSLEPNWPSVA